MSQVNRRRVMTMARQLCTLQ